MKKTTKLVSVLLALLMAFSVLPIAVFAEEPAEETALADNAERVAGWKENHQLLLDTLFDNGFFTSWRYVDENQKALKQTSQAYTFFALYDKAWENAIDRTVGLDDAKKILLAIIEKAEYKINDDYVDDIVKLLGNVKDGTELLEKAQDILNKNIVDPEQLGKATGVIGQIIEVLNKYQKYSGDFEKAFAQVLSVQLANAYYIDLLKYVADNAENDTLAQAAGELAESMNRSVADVVGEIVEKAIAEEAAAAVETLLRGAMDTNVYTATVLKVYDGATSVANVIWGTDDIYPFMDTLILAYSFQDCAAKWAKAALDGEDADKAVAAIDFLISTRTVCEEALKNFKLADKDSVSGKVNAKLYGTIYDDIDINVAALAVMGDIMLKSAVDDFRKIVDALYVFCPVSIDVLNAGDNSVLCTLANGEAGMVKNDCGVFGQVYADYSKDYLKIAYLYDNYRIRLNGTAGGNVTLILDKLAENGTVNDWSFTDVKVDKNSKIVFDTAFAEDAVPIYTYSDGVGIYRIKFNDDFVPSEKPQASSSEVADALGEVGKDEAKSFAQKIKDFFQKILDFFKKLFHIK